MSGETRGPCEGLEGERKEARDDVTVQESSSAHVEHTVREEPHDSEKPSRSPQPPTQPPMQERERISVKSRPPVTKRKLRVTRKPSVSREENKRRLEGQRLEFERKREERKKGEEAAAAAAARAQVKTKECLTNAGEHPRSGSEDEEARRNQQHRPTLAAKVDDDQKVNNDDTETVGVPEFHVLDHDTGATCLAFTDEEHSELELIMMAHPTSALSYAPPSPPITPRYSSDSAFSHSGLGHCYYGSDATRQCECQYQYGLVREDSQTGIESNYLFDPPLPRWPSPKPVESAQTRQDATDVLFQPSGGSAGTAIITVIIPAKTEYYFQTDGACTINTTHDYQRGRHVTGRGGHSGSHNGFRSRGRGGRGPGGEMS